MAEPYSDEQVLATLELVDARNADEPFDSADVMRTVATFRRLMAERDEARRLARTLARLASRHRELYPDERQLVLTALSYFEVPRG